MKGINVLSGIINTLGPLDDHSMQLIILAAVVASKSPDEIYEQLELCIKSGVDTSCIYHTIMGLSGTIGINRTLEALKSAELVINYAKKPVFA